MYILKLEDVDVVIKTLFDLTEITTFLLFI
jgi:hypothetical protein